MLYICKKLKNKLNETPTPKILTHKGMTITQHTNYLQKKASVPMCITTRLLVNMNVQTTYSTSVN